VPEQQPLPEKWIRPEHEQRIDRLEAENARLRATVPEQQPEHDPRRRFCNTFNKCAQFRDLEAENARLRQQERSLYQRALDAEAHAAFGPMDVDARVRALRALVDQLERERDDARAQAIRELRDAASDEGPQSAYWLAADYLERK
jgi:hypothetical protein